MPHAVFPTRQHSRTRRTVQISGWGKPQLKAELERIAGEEGISLSQTVVAILEAGVAQKLHIRQEILVQPILEAVIEKTMNRLINNLAEYLGRSAFDAGQMRWLFVNKLYREVLHPDKALTQEEFYTLLDTSRKETVKHMHRFNATINDVVAAIKARLTEGDSEQPDRSGNY